MTQKQINMLKSAVDLSISNISQALPTMKDEVSRAAARTTLKDFMELHEEINKFKPTENGKN